ncbi:MAG: ABC transporter substrate-binding protein [Eubacteriaceae bacterium]|nr:ABC transporter substrate-binding protein [Eubacteriaceae bacterium]
MAKYKSRLVLAAIAAALAFASCKPAAENGTGQEEAGNKSKFLKVENSNAFSIEYLEDGAKMVTDAENQKFLLVPRGEPAPEGYEDAIVLYTPVERALSFSSTQVGMIAHYDGILDYFAGVSGDAGTWGEFTNIEEYLASGKIRYIGSNTPDYELIQEIDPELAFVFTGTSTTQTDLINMLAQLGIPVAVDNEYMEETHLGRLEWTKFLAAFFGYEEEASSYVDQQVENLAQMEALVAGRDKPKVVWGTVRSGIVYVPGNESYVAGAVRAAGGDYLFSHIPGVGSTQISLEEFYTVLAGADIWIYSSNKNYMPSYRALLELAPVAADAPVVVERNVWQFDVFYYVNTNQADMQVVDLAAIFHPDVFEGHKIRHYNPVGE